MPRGDGTGSNGLGPMTGWIAGYCNGYPGLGFANSKVRYGCARGVQRGYFRGWFNGCRPAFGEIPSGELDPAVEIRILSNQIKSLENSLHNAKERLNELQDR